MLPSTSLRRRLQKGLTLVELMVGLVMGLLIILALLTLLMNVNRNSAELGRTNSVIESGRFAHQLLEQDLVHAGFWGGYVPTYDDLSLKIDIPPPSTATKVAFPTGVPDPCAPTGTWDAVYIGQLVALPIQVYPVPATGAAPVCADDVLAPDGTSLVQPNTDVLLVRHTAPCPAVPGASEPDCQDTANNMFFQVSRCKDDAAAFVLSASAADLVMRDGKCTASPYAPKYRFVSTLYWIRKYFVNTADNIPTLVRTRFQLVGGVLKHQSTETLIEGVESMRIQLGVDTRSKSGAVLDTASFQVAVAWASSTAYYTPTNRGDGNADTYLTCSAAANPCGDAFNLANTVAIKVDILARAVTPTPGYVDPKTYTVGGTTIKPTATGFKRHVYSQTTRLNNVSMRREVPTT